ncbi:MAG TPA: nitrate/nitrite transporter [Dehalococcoidia bacterium]|nr:nitrate/nitrite transporter [Dehalococcoidia bacterium]MDP6273921.1 nitrate/nitrite transporter [Dehalococcoidia bacterium]MDP7212543.1 nitrate/nitrite transporter [Dehalococcoidia bacterium]MDP7514308.1 nitrate/nitrite transporter [Dehalococcoidia bacterium]HJM52476.1 nitrate/nitrite transporter [Dehalococcoidia bacterium]
MSTTSSDTPSNEAHWLTPGWIEDWDPEDKGSWERRGKKVAWKNLLISIPSLHLAFLVWLLWSAIVVNMNSAGFDFTVGELFWLTAIPGLTGPTLRIAHSFLPSLLGGRLTHIISVGSLLIPTVWLFFAIQDVDTSWSTFMMIGALAGFGGGNFASSMSNISSFFPRRQQGLALGLNAGLGNLGVSVVQLVTPLIIGVGFVGDSMIYREGKFIDGEWVTTVGGTVKDVYLQSGLLIWIVPIVATLIAATLFMNSIKAFSLPLKDQMEIFKLKNTWTMTWLYTMAFGSFIGYSAAFPLTIKLVYGGLDDAPEGLALKFAFLGPLVGSLIRPIGGWLSDKYTGAIVTLVAGIGLIISSLAVTAFTHPTSMDSFPYFLGVFLLMFFFTGLLNGSTFRMIGVIKEFNFRTRGPTLGWTSAVAAYGAFIIPIVFKGAIERTNAPDQGLYGFCVFYGVSMVILWYFYLRKGAEEYGA